jgi:hypothetical protein
LSWWPPLLLLTAADGMRLAGSLWQCTRLVEEENTDQILSELAEDTINPAAAT